MKKKILCAAVMLYSSVSYAQLTIESGATLYIGAGAKVTVQGDVTSDAHIQGPGTLLLKGSALQTIDMGGYTVQNLEMDNTANATLANGTTVIGSNLNFINGRIRLAGQNMLIASAATITGYNTSRFIETNGTGQLTRQALGATAFTYPIGFSGTEYNPLTLANNGTADDISINCLQNVLVNGTTGAPVTADFANNSWVINEAVPGGSNFSFTGEWATTDELPGFNRTKSGIAKYVSGTDWDLPANNVATASGSGPYSRNRLNILTPGVYAVADLEFVNRAAMNLKVFLQGAYAGSTGGMRDNYRVANSLPSTQPYGTGKFVHLGVQGGTETFNPAILSTTGSNAIIDWVFVTLHDPFSPALKFQTRAALIQRDGDIVDMDGVSPLSMPINSDGNYIVSVGHRNHLSVRLPNTSPLNLVENAAPASWDFSTAMSQAFIDGTILTNQPMISVTASSVSRFCLIGGNTDGVASATINGRRIIYSGSGNDRSPILTTGLSGNGTTNNPITAANFVLMARYDLNMNGSIVYSGAGNDPLVISNALNGNTSSFATEHQ